MKPRLAAFSAARLAALAAGASRAELLRYPPKDVTGYYRALAREDEPAMLRHALRLARSVLSGRGGLE